MDSILTDILDIQNKIWDIGCNIKINQEEFECLSKAMKELKILYNKISDRQQEENNTDLIINISATLSGKEEIDKAIDELQEKLKNLKINISL